MIGFLVTKSCCARPWRVFATALFVLTLGSVSYVRAVPLLDSTDNLDVIIGRLGLSCPNEEDIGEQANPNRPRSTLNFFGKPCIIIVHLKEKMSKMSEREPLQDYLERNEFQCSKAKSKVNCYHELIYVFSPILFGRRINPDIRNRFITYVEFTQGDSQYIPEEDIKIDFIRFMHQDKPNDPAIRSESHSIYHTR
jgi:hypothetical protein